MSFTKAAFALLFASMAMECALSAQPTDDNRTIELAIKPQLTPKDKVVDHTDMGLPITQFGRSAVAAGKQLGEAMLQVRQKAEKEGRIAPRAIKTWDELSRETEAYVKEHGPITTKRFILPGTTPHESEQIHASDAGLSVCGPEARACLVTKRKAEPIPLKKAVPQSGDFQASRLQSGKTERILEVRRIRERMPASEAANNKYQKLPVKPSKPTPRSMPSSEDLSLPAEERYRLYFKDERPVSLLENLVKAIIPTAQAETASFTEAELKALREAHERITAQAHDQSFSPIKELKAGKATEPSIVEEALRTVQAHRDATQRAMASMGEKSASEDNLAPLDAKEEMTFIFVSYSLGDDVILDILRRKAGHETTTVVMRGVPEGANLASGLKRMQDLARQVTPEPNIILDPTLFSMFSVKAVPTVVRVKRESAAQGAMPNSRGLSLIAKVEGLHNDDWLLERIAQGQTGNLGQQGPIFPIAERDLIEVIKERVMAIDWDAKKKAAIERFWANRTFIDLPQAQVEQIREIDPSVVLTQDMTDGSGTVIHKKGDRVNPLSIMPFTSEILVFNPTREDERELIWAHLASQTGKPYQKRIFIATAIDQNRGWAAYEELVDWLDAPLYLLTPEIQTRFHIEQTPSVVTANHRVFKVRTLAKENRHESK